MIGTSEFMPRSAIAVYFPIMCHMKVLRIYPVTRGPLITHLVVTDYLQRLVDELKTTAPDASFSIHCDTSPLADRYMAYLAGLGFYGKNKCFITNPTWGSIY